MTPTPATDAEIEELASALRERTAFKYAGDCKCGSCQLVPRKLIDDILPLLSRLTSEKEAREKAETLCERLRMEAQHHAGEARCHKSSLHEAYQACSGATGEPGNWHGAVPIREALAASEAAREKAERERDEARKKAFSAGANFEVIAKENQALIDANDTLTAKLETMRAALGLVIEKFDDEIHSGYGGTSMYATRLAEIDSAREAHALSQEGGL